MKNEIKNKIEKLDLIWDEIIQLDDQIRITDAQTIKCINEKNWSRAYELESTKLDLNIRIELLRDRSNVLEKTIMTMLAMD